MFYTVQALPLTEMSPYQRYHGDDGNVFTGSGQGSSYGPTFTTGDVIGCCYDMVAKNVFFTKNGENLDTAFKDVSTKGPVHYVQWLVQITEHK